MKSQTKRTIAILLTVCFVLSITAATVSATAGNPNPGVVPVNSNSQGKTYGELSEEWWKWATSIPASSNPLLANGQVDASIGQSGDVWFLAGTLGGFAERTCEIPAGKALFFPIINVVDTSSVPPIKNNLNTQKALKAVTTEFINNVTTHDVTVDDINLDNFRVGSKLFVVKLPEGNIFEYLGEVEPAGSYRAVSDGYWIMLESLSKGIHTIHIHGKTNYQGYDIETEVVYHITVT